jgi:flagellar hook assembly protein FlgD
MVISVCFTPNKPGDFKGRISFKMAHDSLSIPVWGKGIRPDEVSKQPKTDVTIVSLKKGKEANIKIYLATQSKVMLQIMDELGQVVRAYFQNEVVNPGNHEQIFDCTDKGGKKIPSGTFYARTIITDVNTNRETKMTKKFTIK